MILSRLMPRRLAPRLAGLMTLAMLPLGLISIYQTKVVVDEANALSRAALLAQTVSAASQERQLIVQAIGAAQGLGKAVLASTPEGCKTAMRSFVDANEAFVFAGFVPLDGVMRCSSSETVVDFSGYPNFQAALSQDGPVVEINLSGAVTQQSVILVSHPVQDQGRTTGLVTISIPHSIANALMYTQNDARGLQMASLNGEGTVISASGGLDAAQAFLPSDLTAADLKGHSGTTFVALTETGEQRFFAVEPLVDDTLYLVGSWPTTAVDLGVTRVRAGGAVLFPILMWGVGIAVAVIGLQQLVIRHVTQLRSAMRQFALGARDSQGLVLDDPPQELEEAERAFNRMAILLSEAEHQREADLRDKSVLLKEVHHRVKNNLQLIISIMNMQARKTQSDEARRVLSGLQQRVRGLAMLHQSLYTTTENTSVDSADLINTVIGNVAYATPHGQKALDTRIAAFPLYPDQALPLSMLLAEALTNAFKYSGKHLPDAPVHVMLETLGTSDVRLTIRNPVDPQTVQNDENGDGLGSRLMTAFVRQLDGQESRSEEGGFYQFQMTFPRRDFDPGQD